MAGRYIARTVHAVAECEDCGWSYCNHKNALAIGAKHAYKTGHMVQVELGSYVTYKPKTKESITDAQA